MFRFDLLRISLAVAVFLQPTGGFWFPDPTSRPPPGSNNVAYAQNFGQQNNMGYMVQNPLPYNYALQSNPREQQYYSNGQQDMNSGYYGSSGVNNPIGYDQNQNPSFIPQTGYNGNPGHGSNGGYNTQNNQNPSFIPNDPRQQSVYGGQGQGQAFANQGGFQELPPQHSGYGGSGGGSAPPSPQGAYATADDVQRRIDEAAANFNNEYGDMVNTYGAPPPMYEPGSKLREYKPQEAYVQDFGAIGYDRIIQRQQEDARRYAEEQERARLKQAEREKDRQASLALADPPPPSIMSDERGFDKPRRRQKKTDYEDYTSIGNFNPWPKRRNIIFLCIICFIAPSLHMIL